MLVWGTLWVLCEKVPHKAQPWPSPGPAPTPDTTPLGTNHRSPFVFPAMRFTIHGPDPLDSRLQEQGTLGFTLLTSEPALSIPRRILTRPPTRGFGGKKASFLLRNSTSWQKTVFTLEEPPVVWMSLPSPTQASCHHPAPIFQPSYPEEVTLRRAPWGRFVGKGLHKEVLGCVSSRPPLAAEGSSGRAVPSDPRQRSETPAK